MMTKEKALARQQEIAKMTREYFRKVDLVCSVYPNASFVDLDDFCYEATIGNSEDINYFSFEDNSWNYQNFEVVWRSDTMSDLMITSYTMIEEVKINHTSEFLGRMNGRIANKQIFTSRMVAIPLFFLDHAIEPFLSSLKIRFIEKEIDQVEIDDKFYSIEEAMAIIPILHQSRLFV